MTQTASQPVPAPQPAHPTAQPANAARASVVPSSTGFTENVPQLLNRLQAVAVATCVVFGLVAASIQLLSWQANGRAADNTEQVVRVQQIQSLLLRADAIATNSYLVGGLEPADARAAYDEAIDSTLRLVADAAEAQPADREVLADLNATITSYTTSVAQARDYNRQQFPIGIAYLNDAGRTLRADALPIVEALVGANSERAVDEMGEQHPLWLLGLALLALLVLYWVNRQLARRFHRRYNPGVLAAVVVVLLVALIGAGHATVKNDDNEATRDGPYRTAVDEASARTAANDAKSQESQGLINRGAGAGFEETFAARAVAVEDTAGDATLPLWQAYVVRHEEVRALDDGGDWNGAVALAIDTEDGSPTALLDAFDAASQQVVADSGATAADEFRTGTFLWFAAMILTLLGALVAAAFASRGIDLRRREYS